MEEECAQREEAAGTHVDGEAPADATAYGGRRPEEEDPHTADDEPGSVPCVEAEAAVEVELRVECELRGEAEPRTEEGAVGCTGSDSGVDGCGGRALSSGGGSRSCASSVVSCGSACGSESSSLAADSAPPRLRKRVAVAEPNRAPGVAPRTTAPRGPNLATRERARSREKPVPPEKPRPLTPKPRVRPNADLPPVTRESPAPRVKPTRTSSARCRKPGTPSDDGKWPSPPSRNTPPGFRAGEAAKPRASLDSKATLERYATLPRRRKEPSPETSPKREARSSSAVGRKPPVRDREHIQTRAAPRVGQRARVRIYHETGAQTVLTGRDVERALGGAPVRTEAVRVERRDRGVQADGRRAELGRLETQLRQVTAAAARQACELEEERAAKLAALAALAARDAPARTAADIIAKHQDEINKLYGLCTSLRREAETSTLTRRELERQLAEAESEHAEMQDFLCAEKAALQDALREAEIELARRRAECRQLVRMSEQRRQETLAAQARLRGAGGGAAGGLDQLARRLQTLLDTLVQSYSIAGEELEDVIYHNEAFSRSASSGSASPSGAAAPARGSSLLAAVVNAIKGATSGGMPGTNGTAKDVAEGGKASDEENSADLLDSETEPCLMMENVLEDVSMPDTHSHNLVSSGLSLMSSSLNPTMGLATSISAIQITDSKQNTQLMASSLGFSENRQLSYYNKEDSCNSLQNLATFSADELSPVNKENLTMSDSIYGDEKEDAGGYEYSEHESLQNLSQAIMNRQQSEAECSMSEDLLSNKENDEYYLKASNCLVDKVILVDNLLTKLLKVLRIIQLENESSVQQLNAVKEKIGDTEKNVADVVIKKLAELEANKNLMEQYKQTIENMTTEINEERSKKLEDPVVEASSSNGYATGPETGASSPWRNSGLSRSQLRHQYEAIDHALSVLNAVQPVVAACPPLAALQAELETLCFHTAVEVTAPPSAISDCNANAQHAINSAA